MYSVDTKNPGSWDEYFFEMCKTVASNSKCLSRKIGAIIVKDKTIISTGYNGPPRNVRSCDERWLVDKGLRDVAEFTKKYAGSWAGKEWVEEWMKERERGPRCYRDPKRQNTNL